MKKIRIVMYLAVFFLMVLRPMPSVKALSSIGSVEDFNHLSGNAKYLGWEYSNNYGLDMEEREMSDGIGEYFGSMVSKAFNGLANVIFFIERALAYLTVVIFYIGFNLNLADLFGAQLNAIQQALNASVFLPLFLFGCAAAFIVLIGRIAKQDLAGAIGQVAKIILIVMISVLVVTESSTMLTACNRITKEISLEILVGVNSANGYSTDVENFAAQSAGILWENLVHEPWLTLEFGEQAAIDEGEVERILSTGYGSEDRKELIAQDTQNRFSPDKVWSRLGLAFFYLIPCVMKCTIYILVAFVQLVFQLLAILYTFMAPLVLIVSMFPGYNGILEGWLRKMLESQLSILIISLIIGILIKFDELIFAWTKSNGYGWIVALMIQIAIAVTLFVNRNNLLTMMSHVQRGISNPRYLQNRMRMAGNVYAAAPGAIRTTKRVVQKTGSMAAAAKEWGVNTFNRMNVPVSWTVNPFIIHERRKAVKEEQAYKESKKQTETGRAAENTVKPASGDIIQFPTGNAREQFRKASENVRPNILLKGPERVEIRSEKGEKSEALKDAAEEMTKKVGHLAEAIEEAGNAIEEGAREKHGEEEVKRPALMERPKEEKTAKEIVITVKGQDGKEEQKKLENAGHKDMQTVKQEVRESRESAEQEIVRPRMNTQAPKEPEAASAGREKAEAKNPPAGRKLQRTAEKSPVQAKTRQTEEKDTRRIKEKYLK